MQTLGFWVLALTTMSFAIAGSASESSVLFQAGVMDADLCLAVTSSDEGNMIAASMA